MRCALVIPLKAFALAKGRLAGVLDDRRRVELARSCAAAVVAAAGDWAVYVVTASDDVAEWATSVGARTVADPGGGLDPAIEAGRHAAIADGADHVVIAHGDLPLARSLAHVAVEGTITLVPDRRRDGTNVLSHPTATVFTTAYGPGSFERHLTFAEQTGVPVRVIDDADLALDLDTAEDLAEWTNRTGVPR